MSEADKPHHLGHRERLRDRAAQGGLGGLPDYEVLELYLQRSVPRQDVKERAKALIRRFGSLQGVLAAPLVELVQIRGVGEAVALDLKLVHELARRMGREALDRRPVISSWTALLDYVRVAIGHEPREQVRVLYLDTKNQLILDEETSRGTINHAPLYPREVVRRALELSAASMILVHNHPSGDTSPSAADIAVTKEVVAAAKPLGIDVHDHVIVGRHGVESLKARGLM